MTIAVTLFPVPQDGTCHTFVPSIVKETHPPASSSALTHSDTQMQVVISTFHLMRDIRDIRVRLPPWCYIHPTMITVVSIYQCRLISRDVCNKYMYRCVCWPCLNDRQVRFRPGLWAVNDLARNEVHHSLWCLLDVPRHARLSRLCRGRPRPCSRRLPARGAAFVFSSKIPIFYSYVKYIYMPNWHVSCRELAEQ